MKEQLFAEIILPLAVRGSFTYRVPDRLGDKIFRGSRVAVQFGSKRLYSGLVFSLSLRIAEGEKFKEVIEALDDGPILNDLQIDLWKWIAEYYMCTPGEVMKAALPSGLCLESETLLSGESLKEKYAPREETYIKLSKKYSDEELNEILDKLARAPRQQNLLSDFIRITGYYSGSELNSIKRSTLIKEAGAQLTVLAALQKRGILVSFSREVSRLTVKEDGVKPLRELTTSQSQALESVKAQMRKKDIVLLHGVTSSGKTEIYIHLIDEQLKQGRQVLYLLPEIALTSQITDRLMKHFGQVTEVYHSRLNDASRVEIWRKVMERGEEKGIRLIIGVRSSLFLPFHSLGLVIVDEEHDTSYKQHDPSPRYHARDSAIMLASIAGAKTLLGSATPSLESYYNASQGKYGLIKLENRYGDVRLPEIEIANTREAYRKKLMVSHFSPQLLNAVDNALGNGEQVVLFRNRRGFSPYIECSECGWVPLCSQCSVRLTYHRENNRLKCHYCGFSCSIPIRCDNCGSVTMVTRGFGTEKLEDEIKIVFPKARVARLDHDTTRSKSSLGRIIESFERGETDILIGTQMVSKGLDFENLTIVGILDADNMLNFPDFRAYERAFQLVAQVSGRAGRRSKKGRVIIQTSDPDNKILKMVINNDYNAMFTHQMEERKLFNYPPFCRMIRLTVKHKDIIALNHYSDILGSELRKVFGSRVLGPEAPVISKIQMWHIRNIQLKIEREKPMNKARVLIADIIARTEKMIGASALRISADVDPY